MLARVTIVTDRMADRVQERILPDPPGPGIEDVTDLPSPKCADSCGLNAMSAKGTPHHNGKPTAECREDCMAGSQADGEVLWDQAMHERFRDHEEPNPQESMDEVSSACAHDVDWEDRVSPQYRALTSKLLWMRASVSLPTCHLKGMGNGPLMLWLPGNPPPRSL